MMYIYYFIIHRHLRRMGGVLHRCGVFFKAATSPTVSGRWSMILFNHTGCVCAWSLLGDHPNFIQCWTIMLEIEMPDDDCGCRCCGGILLCGIQDCVQRWTALTKYQARIFLPNRKSFAYSPVRLFHQPRQGTVLA
jgi:hypothetical protein